MWEIWANWLLPQALKSCPKSNKSPNLVTLFAGHRGAIGMNNCEDLGLNTVTEEWTLSDKKDLKVLDRFDVIA